MPTTPAKPESPEQSEQKHEEEEQHQEEQEEHEEQLEEWQGVSSSMVAEVNYSEGEIGVIFNSGSEESYAATEAQFEELLNAPSIGKWMWANFGDQLGREE